MILKKYICRFEKDFIPRQRYFEYTCFFIVQKGRVCKIYGKLQSTTKQLSLSQMILFEKLWKMSSSP